MKIFQPCSRKKKVKRTKAPFAHALGVVNSNHQGGFRMKASGCVG